MRHRVRLFFAALTMHLAVGLCAQAPVLELPCTADSWKADVRGKSAVGFDRREICRINHPWEMSAAGDYGEISRMVTIPKDWKPPYWLRWYASDNYVAEGVDHSNLKEGGGYLLMIGHRFKQVLVDDNVVWERDVADPILPGPKARPSEPAGSDAP